MPERVSTDDLYLLLFFEVQPHRSEGIRLVHLGALSHTGLKESRDEKVFYSSLGARKQLINASTNELSTDCNVRSKIRLSTYVVFAHYQGK